MKRYLEPFIKEDLREKAVFLGGPRQVGKTTLSLGLLDTDDSAHQAYLSWDDFESRALIQKAQIPTEERLIVFDEIHKYRHWRTVVKGLYDRYKGKKQFLVTGSARLDYYRRGGDSLQGRYHYYRLHPLTLGELAKPNSSDIQALLQFGGFPEPFLKATDRFWKRWQRERFARVVQEDLLTLERVREISSVELLMAALPAKVGSPLSLASLREDLQVSFETVDHWVQILERLYYCYRIAPYGAPKLRAAKKEKKLYLWDWSLITDQGAKFENFIASILLKYCHFMEDTEGENMELRFLRDSEKREIDFVVMKGAKPLFAVECKSGDKDLSRHIKYFAPRTSIPVFYQVHLGTKDYEAPEYRSRVLPTAAFCKLIETFK